MNCQLYLFAFLTLFNVWSEIASSFFWFLCIFCVILAGILLQIARVIWTMPWIFSWDIYFICISQFISSKQQKNKKKCDSFSFSLFLYIFCFLFYFISLNGKHIEMDIFIFKESFNILVEKQLNFFYYLFGIFFFVHCCTRTLTKQGGEGDFNKWINIPNIVSNKLKLQLNDYDKRTIGVYIH